ncbi:bacillithiol biosynthesis cysteine-adding enzyme BshC [Dinghuibacter silviterrae]|uniref:Putative cysteine ligase BshC n=1 Tax=Dinghuibacter silviterrae TaxID=1539049 RepID=A0A4R8DS63_9BACT|nr:bacillithiol biosynthesis cysteine-adding enzyme BshC [Dinghuibacter silviterrae]TDX01084.1 bacillithiol biosynthesis cysteine-adding enzyme BshC [Dinghuibacter silviterrae]
MDCIAQWIDYKETGAFSALVSDYVQGADTLRPFYKHPVSLDGLKDAIKEREAFPTDRATLVQTLREQYRSLPPAEALHRNLELLERPTTFVITTAHQPNIFTGHLYFIYKILHAIRLAKEAKTALPDYDFVPVYFMGSEDADLDELGHIYAGGETLTWATDQTGAVGRMSPKGLDTLVHRLEGEFGGLPHGAEMASLIREAYLRHDTIQAATLYMVHALFADYGLVVLIPDDAALKRLFLPLFRRELAEGFSHTAVSGTIARLEEHYKVQAAGRDLNLFYLKDNLRNRIVREGDGYRVVDTDLTFTVSAMNAELEAHPERFSPNVILRGVFQEWVLPGIAFIGGGGELAYWLELKEVFAEAGVPYPVLVLRNSFLLVKQAVADKAARLDLPLPCWFAPEPELVNALVRRDSTHPLSLTEEIDTLRALYDRLSTLAGAVDVTLQPHVGALGSRALEGLHVLEKKLLKAEKQHFDDQRRQIHTIKGTLFPKGGLQERVENFMPYYAEYGRDLIEVLYQHSLGLEAKFCLLTIP